MEIYVFAEFNSMLLAQSWIISYVVAVVVLCSKKNMTDTFVRKDILASVTRSGNFLDFGQLFKAFGNN